MKAYPSIDHKIQKKLYITAFDKLDGSNIRAEWSVKKGFYKFGSRKRLLDETDKHLGKSIYLIKQKEYEFDKILRKKFNQNIICFFEFWGLNSAFGQHKIDDNHEVTLIDVNVYKQGLLPPRDFIKIFGHLNTPKVLYEGRAGTEFINKVKNSELEEMTFEGVVCKAPNPNKKKTSKPVMFKIKSNAWLEKLREYCKGNETLFSQLT